MKDDMRLKSMVVKGSKVGIIPCLYACDELKTCPCEDFRKYMEGKDTSDITSVEMEWIHVPVRLNISNWIQWVFPVVTIILLVVILVRGCRVVQPERNLRTSLSENGYVVECWTDSAASFEEQTNDIERIKKDLQALKCK